MGTRALRRSRPVVAEAARLVAQAPPGARAARDAPAAQRRAAGGHPCAAGARSTCPAGSATSLALRDLVRDPVTALAAHLRTALAVLRPTSSTWRPTRPSATTPSTSSTRWASTSPSRGPAATSSSSWSAVNLPSPTRSGTPSARARGTSRPASPRRARRSTASPRAARWPRPTSRRSTPRATPTARTARWASPTSG